MVCLPHENVLLHGYSSFVFRNSDFIVYGDSEIFVKYSSSKFFTHFLIKQKSEIAPYWSLYEFEIKLQVNESYFCSFIEATERCMGHALSLFDNQVIASNPSKTDTSVNFINNCFDEYHESATENWMGHAESLSANQVIDDLPGTYMNGDFQLHDFSAEDIVKNQISIFGVDPNNLRDKKRWNYMMDVLRRFYSIGDEKLTNFIFGEKVMISEELKYSTKDKNMWLDYTNGGPGCAKTTRCIELIQRLEKKNNRIAVTCLSNEHISNLGLRMIGKVRFSFRFSQLALKRGLIPEQLQYKRKKENVILATMSNAYKQKLFKGCDVLFIDEVSRLTLAELILFCEQFRFKRIITFGDIYQANVYNADKIKSLLMQPLTNFIDKECINYRNVSYRFGNKTVDILNLLAYKECPLISQASKDIKNKEEVTIKYFCSGKFCDNEVKVVVEEHESFKNEKALDYLLDIEDYENSIVVVPYLGQKLFYENHHLNVVTIDGFQGREHDKIILDLTRCNTSNKIGFVQDLTRFIVAISRHRYKLTILSCKNLAYSQSCVLHTLIRKGLLTEET